jgi:hypothetical protein
MMLNGGNRVVTMIDNCTFCAINWRAHDAIGAYSGDNLGETKKQQRTSSK